MKITSILFFLLFSFFATDFAAQEKIWFDVNSNVTTKEKAVYYRLVSSNKNEKQQIIDYYISGKKAKEFSFVKGKENGKYSEFYSSGELKTIGKFDNGRRDGVWKTYYKNGKIKEKGKYNKGEKVGVWKIYYKND
ncbi:hypothetical protein H9I45_14440 [Polaribacter haliotis]|uniref:Toxin-antitoxin system YwqK family antitoxin n=1 Tax=Polaribacter haliotis TaxID=1888915 RepID=A0A7L8AF09_9FLAO|nr:hypothetical protein [Polaribacter haliotis]QOD60524.1 hypothetical protein H9I45_14440 [Polaribacter haliotis]